MKGIGRCYAALSTPFREKLMDEAIVRAGNYIGKYHDLIVEYKEVADTRRSPRLEIGDINRLFGVSDRTAETALAMATISEKMDIAGKAVEDLGLPKDKEVWILEMLCRQYELFRFLKNQGMPLTQNEYFIYGVQFIENLICAFEE